LIVGVVEAGKLPVRGDDQMVWVLIGKVPFSHKLIVNKDAGRVKFYFENLYVYTLSRIARIAVGFCATIWAEAGGTEHPGLECVLASMEHLDSVVFNRVAGMVYPFQHEFCNPFNICNNIVYRKNHESDG
jgi:hypothetical protein